MTFAPGLAGHQGATLSGCSPPGMWRSTSDVRPPARVNLVTSGALDDASQAAYQQGLGSVIRVGPLGGLPAAAKLVRISFLDPADRQDGLRVTLRWEPTGPAGGCGGACDGSTTPGVIGFPGPKISVCTRSSEMPQAISPSLKSRRNGAGPHR